MEKQRTIKESFSLSGKGLHTGLNLTVEFCPAPENHGYKIQRVDDDANIFHGGVRQNTFHVTLYNNERYGDGNGQHCEEKYHAAHQFCSCSRKLPIPGTLFS